MTILSEILEYNQKFVENKEYETYITDKYPEKKIVILTCMDARLVELLQKAMNLRNGDAKIIKNAGAIITQPFGSVVRSILIGIYEFNADEVLIIGHSGCGMTQLNSDAIVEKIKARGISTTVLDTLENSGIKMNRFLRGFNSVEEGVRNSVNVIRNHPLMPEGVHVHGLIIDSETGKLDMVVDEA
ncbi:carbonic anhydrase [Paenibacillus selenitireducens]|uniref:carbonic anhydrase n=1 Tax=Paenibacillus selenitireducens TaxID=1324314 RepID=A0A1T2X4D7_9BACL|nr:carbonic anhydrase [Paenibacillus selenitireducens]OPA74712.1 carbonic anhydrase [Paenibacillus selenitireducens]